MVVALQLSIDGLKAIADGVAIHPLRIISNRIRAGNGSLQKMAPPFLPPWIVQQFFQSIQTAETKKKQEENREPDGRSGNLRLDPPVLDSLEESREMEHLPTIPKKTTNHFSVSGLFLAFI